MTTAPAPLTAGPAPAPAPAPAEWWGSLPHPEGAICGWSARGIVERVTRGALTPTGRVRKRAGRPVSETVWTVSLVYNRQAAFGPAGLRAALEAIVGRVLRDVRAAVEADPHVEAGEVEVGPGVRALFRNDGPGGYCRISVWIIDAPPPEGAMWSGAARGIPAPPLPGDRVRVRMNGIGPGTVLGRFTEYGYAGLVVLPDDPPDWYVRQNGAGATAGVFGAEIEPL